MEDIITKIVHVWKSLFVTKTQSGSELEQFLQDRAVIAKWIIGSSNIVSVVQTVTLISSNGVEGSKTALNMLVPMIGT